MVKKKGKARQDKYYYLAKETGYRARSAFKLLQLNKKYNFLQSSQVLVDLCAAPGGWLQVASEHMPMSSTIVGVDLVPIRPVPRCVTFQDDITKETCRSQLKRELQQEKADVFLHDGAPNVGKNWLQDAFSQSVLTLHALKLACDFLQKGGWFITKVFRSKDYQSLMWVFRQLFSKVHATKPQASRTESAEIFLVCQGYKCPDKIDKKFFDVRSVFEDVDIEQKKVKLADFLSGKKKKAAGYEENKGLLFTKKPLTEFLQSNTPLQFLNNVNQLVVDDECLLNNQYLTKDLVDSLTDIKSIGRREIKKLLKLHDKHNSKISREEKTHKKKSQEEEQEKEDSDEEIERQLEEIREAESKLLKKKKRDVLKERKKLRERMSHSGHSSLANTDLSLFALTDIKSADALEKVANADVDDILIDESSDDDESLKSIEDSDDHESDDDVYDPATEYSQFLKESESDDAKGESDNEEAATNENPLLKSLGNKADAKLFFDKDIFKKIEDNTNDFEEVKQAENYYEIKNKAYVEKAKKEAEGRSQAERGIADYENSSSETDSDYDEDAIEDDGESKTFPGTNVQKRKLSAKELALGTAIATSKKKKRDLIDDSFNRNTYNDEEADLPDWFIEDEKKAMSFDYVENHVSKTDVKYYQAKDININARTIKKVAEAKARKKKRMHKKREKVRKQAESITESDAMSNAEKAAQIKSLYKKAGLLKKKREEKTYVFARRGTGKKVSRPPGVKGKFQVVDRRMKKDKRAQLKGNKKHLQKLKRGKRGR